MADELKANIEINIHSNVDEQIQLIKAQFNAIRQTIDESMNSPMSVTDDLIKQIGQALGQLVNNTNKLEGNIPVQQFESAKSVIEELRFDYVNLKQEFKNNEAIEEFKAHYQALEKVISGGLNNTFEISNDTLKSLPDAFDTLIEKAKALQGIVSDTQYEKIGITVEQLQGKLDALSDKWFFSDMDLIKNVPLLDTGGSLFDVEKPLSDLDKLVQKQREAYEERKQLQELELQDRLPSIADGGMMSKLLENSTFKEINKEVVESTEEWRERVTKAVDDMNGTIGNLRVNSVFEGIKNEVADVQNEISNSGDTLKENVESRAEELLNDIVTLYDDFGNMVRMRSDQYAEEFIESYEYAGDEIEDLFNDIEDDLLPEELASKLFEESSWDDFSEDVDDSGDSVSSLGDEFKALIGEIDVADIAVKGIKKAWDEFSDTLQEVIELAEDIGGSLVGAFETVNEVIEGTIDLTEELADKFYNLADKGVTLQKKWFTIFNYMGGQGGTEIQGFLNDLQAIYGVDADNLTQGMRSIDSAVRNMGLSAEQSVKAVKQFTGLGLDLSAYTGIDYNSIVSQIQSSVNMGYLGRNSPLIQALGLTDKDVETFKSLNTQLERANFLLSKGAAVGGTYEKWIHTAAGKVELFSNALSRLDGDVQRLAIQLFAKLAPALTAIINLVDNLVVGITKLFGYDLTGAEANLADMGMEFSGLSNGLESVPEEIEEVADSVDNVSDNMDDMSDNADEAKKHLASFDDVIQINDTDDNAFSNLGDTGDIEDLGDSLTDVNDILDGLQGFDFGDWGLDDKERELSELEEKLQEIADLLLEGKFDEAGQKLNSLLQDALVGIPWEEIQEKASKTGIAIAQFLNGLLEDKELFTEVGNFFAQGLNTVVYLIRDFAGELHWDEVGEALSKSWKGFWEGFDSAALGEALFNVIHGVFEALRGFVEDMWTVDEESGLNGWDLAGSKIADVLNTFFSNWTDEDIENAANSVIQFINGVFETLKSFIENLDTEDIKEKLLLFIRKAFEGIVENAGDWGATIGEVVQFIIELIQGTIEEYDSSGLRDAIKEFLSNAHIGDLVWSIMLLRLKIWWEELCIETGVKLEGLGDLIIDGLLEIFKKLATFGFELGMDIYDWFREREADFDEFVNKIKEQWDLWQESFNETIDNIKNIFAGIINWWSDTVVPWFNNIGTGVDNLLNGIATSISTSLNNILNGIQTFIDGLSSAVETVKGYFADIGNFGDNWLSGARDIAGNLLGKFNISIPHLAKGGIIGQSTLVNVGEAGREAVVPLENNTGWMKSLANEFVNQMNINNNTSSNNTTVNISMGNKMVYTRSEMLEFGKQIAEALELYGVTVTMN